MKKNPRKSSSLVQLEPLGNAETFQVASSWTQRRIDQVLTSLRQDISRSIIQHLIREGWVLVNGKKVKSSYRLHSGDRITVQWGTLRSSEPLQSCPKPVHILKQQKDYLVVFKPPGLVVHPGAGHHSDTLVQRLLHHYPEIRDIGHPLRPGIVHRLDRETSGLLIVARSPMGYLHFIHEFKKHRIKKIYLALTWGVPQTREGSVFTQIGRDPRNRKRFAVGTRYGKPALTKYRLIEQGEWMSLLKLRLVTGRTHQARVHMRHLGCPVVGDRVYGRKHIPKNVSENILSMLNDLENREALALLAYRISFFAPLSGLRETLVSPIPRWFKQLAIADGCLKSRS